MSKKRWRCQQGKPQRNAQAASSAALEPKSAPRFPLGNGFYWEFDKVSNGMGGYRVIDAYLLQEDDPEFSCCIVDHDGEIQNFPGFRDGPWRADMEFPVDMQVRFTFRISPFKEGKAAVYWLLQPDGRYFADEDGYGAERCEEVELYSSLDEQGRFIEPFGTPERDNLR